MHIPHAELLAVEWLVGAATLSILFWIVQYTFTSPWWRDPVGRTFVYKDFFLLILLVLACLAAIWPNLLTIQEELIIELIVFGGIFVVVTWRCVVFWRIHRPGLAPLRDFASWVSWSWRRLGR